MFQWKFRREKKRRGRTSVKERVVEEGDSKVGRCTGDLRESGGIERAIGSGRRRRRTTKPIHNVEKEIISCGEKKANLAP